MATKTYTATITHASISRARVIHITGSLLAAKQAATREFAGDFNDYNIVISDADGRTVAIRKMDARQWSTW